MARSHRGNPAASVRIHQLYANPVLMLGLGALVLSDSEIATIDQHHKEVLRNLQRLLPCTPKPSYTSMPETYLLLSQSRQDPGFTVFVIFVSCTNFPIPHTFCRGEFKPLVKKHVIDYWEQKLRAEASGLSSLEYFRPELMSLKHPQPSIW